MNTVSLRLPDDLLKEAEHRAKSLHLPRAEYIRRAIADQLMKTSERIAAASMKVNAEFDATEDAPRA
jgi:predicted transcriptional regulator